MSELHELMAICRVHPSARLGEKTLNREDYLVQVRWETPEGFSKCSEIRVTLLGYPNKGNNKVAAAQVVCEEREGRGYLCEIISVNLCK